MTNYFDGRKRLWKWRVPEGVAEFYARQRTVQDYFDSLVTTGFLVERILEPEPYDLSRMTECQRRKIPYFSKYYLKYYDIWSKAPYTMIFKAKKPLEPKATDCFASAPAP